MNRPSPNPRTKPRRKALYLLFGVASVSAFTIATPNAAAKNKSDDASRISRQILEALIEANGVAGMSAAVWRDDAIVWTAGVGYRDLENRLPVKNSTIFRLASVSKIFAVTAAAKLREQGKLDVDQPLQQSIDYLNPKWPAVTPRQLAAHTAGVPHYQAIDARRGGVHFGSVKEAIGVFNDRDLLFAPGTDSAYSSYGYTLLTAVIEKSAGRPYLDYLAREIVPGLQILPDVTGSPNPAASKAYDYESGNLAPSAPHDFSYSWGGAGLGATAVDLARFGGKMLSGRIVSNATFEWMLEPAKLNDGTIVSERDYTVGFGLRSGKDADGQRIAHHAGVVMGARSVLLLYPDQKFAVSLLSNAPWISSIEQTAITLSAPFRVSSAKKMTDPCPINASRYEGSFEGKSVSGNVSFALRNDVCSGKISVDTPMAGWFDRSSRKDVRSVEVISLDADGGLARAAFVTPFGAYELRTTEDGQGVAKNMHEYVATFSAKSMLKIKFY